MRKIKIGQIGIGHNHSDKIKSIKRFPELFELVGWSEDNEEWVERRGSNDHFGDVPRLTKEELLTKCDAVLVETDVWDLTKTALECIRAGKHVHMDKPASGTLEEFKALLDEAESRNLTLQLGYMYRYNPNVEKLLEMAKSGELGDITSIHAEMSTGHSDKYRTWLQNFRGGNMYIFGSHLIDLIVYLMGKPQKVLSHLGSSGKNGVMCTDLSTAVLAYERAVARVFVSSVEINGWARRVFSIAGTEATAELRPIEEPVRMTLARHDGRGSFGRDLAKELPAVELRSPNRYDKMLQEFHACVTGEKENPFSYAHEYAVQEVLNEILGGIACPGNVLP